MSGMDQQEESEQTNAANKRAADFARHLDAVPKLPSLPSKGLYPKSSNTIEVDLKLTWRTLAAGWLAVAILTTASIMSLMGIFLLSFFNRAMEEHTGLNDAQYGMLNGYGYYLISTLAMLLQGYLCDKHTLNRVYVAAGGCVLGGLSLVVQGLARNFTVLLIGVLLNAVGTSVLKTLPYSIISDMLPPAQSSVASAIIGSSLYLSFLISGNMAWAFAQGGVAWQWAFHGNGIIFITTAVAMVACIREPPVGRFIRESKDVESSSPAAHPRLDIGDALRYLAVISTFWIVTIGTGVRWSSGSQVGTQLPNFVAVSFPQHPLGAAEGSIIGVCGFVASLLYGSIGQRFFVRMPAISLYLAAIGSLLSSVFMIFVLCARPIVGGAAGPGFILFVVALCLSILSSEGWQGPIAAMLAYVLPPKIKTFGISLWLAIAQLIIPVESVICSMFLQASAHKWGRGSAAYVAAFQNYNLASIIGGYLLSAAMFFIATRLLPKDTALLADTMANSGSFSGVLLIRQRKALFLVCAALLASAVAAIIAISFIFSYSPHLLLSSLPTMA